MLELALSFWQQTSVWEVAAMLLSLLYLALAIRQNAWCWYAAFASTAIYVVLFWEVALLMESALNGYYLLMAAYGWWRWRHGAKNGAGDDKSVPIVRWHWQQHLLAVTAILALSAVSGYLLTRYTEAAMPFLDSLTSWGAVVTTWMVARKVLENWLYWLVIDAISIYLFIDRGLWVTAGLFMLFEVMVIIGWFKWSLAYRQQAENSMARAVPA